MTARRKAAPKTRSRARTRPPSPRSKRPEGPLAEVAAAVGAAQARVEAEVGHILARGRAGRRSAEALLKTVRVQADRERRKAWRELRTRLAVLSTRLQQERRAASRALDDAVRTALAAFNIPSRAEIESLTRKVEELTRRLESRSR